jgi:hypothetical protein
LGFADGQGGQLGGQRLDLALGGGGIDQRVGPLERHDALYGDARVLDCPVKRGGGLVVLSGHLGSRADFGDQFLLGVEEVGQLRLQLPDLVE